METISYVHSYILVCQLLHSLYGFCKQGFSKNLQPSFILLERYFLFSSLLAKQAFYIILLWSTLSTAKHK